MKTIEEASGDSYCMLVLEHGCNAGSTFGKAMFGKGVEFAQRWIPIEEELPEEDTYVLTLSHRHNGSICYRVIWFRHGGFFSTEQTSNITHWRPIELK